MPINNEQITAETDIESLIVHAISEVPNLQSGEKFMVRDLFIGYEWNRLSSYTRAKVGAGFYYQYAKIENLSEVEILEKSARNQQLYRKKIEKDG